MIVCIAEKPSVARDIAEVLGAHTRKEGYIEGNGYQVTWTFGHLCTLKEPHEYTPNWKSWSLSSLPMIPPRFGIKLIGHDPGIEKQFHVIEWLMQNADEIINCGDAGQEGELIQRWVMQKAGARCPVKRLWISSLTEEAIREGFSKLKDQAEFQSLYEAGLSRAMGDWLLGMNATRLYTLKYGQNKQVLSIGRVQTPTLALIVNRQLEIANFEPKQYWELKTNYRNTTFLSDDIYPKCPAILKGLRDYEVLTAPLAGTTLLKSKKVFDNSKVTDHHAIIPTGVYAQNLTDMERRVYDLIARRFIAVFYPDCKISTTTVMGEVDKIEFRVTGKQILEPGWRVVFAKEVKDPTEEKEEEDENVLPAFVKGESGPHIPDLNEKWTQPPRPYTEATLLRAMETAGKLVDNDELRDALKENGIGRPSTRAAIIETLFKRNYIRKERKNLIATPTGVELVQLIHEELLKSAELTGIWEKKLREIEKKTYDARQFLEELKQMVSEIVMSVLSDNTNRRITIQDAVAAKAVEKEKKEPKKRERKPSTPKEKKPKAEKTTNEVKTDSPGSSAPVTMAASTPSATGEVDAFVGQPCPLCGKGIIIKGKTAYGCSEWRNGCTFRKNF